jgi:hypothetical protein
MQRCKTCVRWHQVSWYAAHVMDNDQQKRRRTSGSDGR